MIKSNTGVNWATVYSLAVSAVGRPAVYISNGNDLLSAKDISDWDWLMSAIGKKYGPDSSLTWDLRSAIINSDLIFFDTIEEMQEFYSLFESAESPLDSGPIYACTFDKSGNLLTENT